MNTFSKIYIRTYQKIMYLGCFFLKFDEPKIIKGEDSYTILASYITRNNYSNPLIVTDEGLHALNMDLELMKVLKANNVKSTLFYNVTANPTIDQVEAGLKVYLDNNCDCIIALGGGSAMDAAKIIGARATNPSTTVAKMKGVLKIKKKLPLLIAIPTTAGTGSETTIAAVISNVETKEKFPIEDPKLVPTLAILNPSLLVKLPSEVTSTTGMDALTHAVEAYIGKSNTKKTIRYAKEAITLIYQYLYKSYKEPENLDYRNRMQIASYDAGVAFTRAYVGYVHAIAHTLGGFYHVPHGLANAVILPIVLNEYGEAAYNRLSDLYDLINQYGNAPRNISKKNKSIAFINSIIDLNRSMNIPSNFKDIIKEEDLPELIERAMQEALPLYPTPVLWGYEEFERVYRILMGEVNV